MTTVPIASLTPTQSNAQDICIDAVVTLLWPYSSGTRQCALLFAEPDFRLRYKKGQVRVCFSGASAQAVATSGIGIGDEVSLRLDGAEWVQSGNAVKTPGRSIDWELVYDRKLQLHIRRNGEIVKDVAVNEPSPGTSPRNTAPATRHAARTVNLRNGVNDRHHETGVYASPAFVKRLRLSDHFFMPSLNDPFADMDEISTEQSCKKRRTTYGRMSGQWRYAERTPSPEKDDAGVASGPENIVMQGLEDVQTPEQSPARDETHVEDVLSTDRSLPQNELVPASQPTPAVLDVDSSTIRDSPESPAKNAPEEDASLNTVLDYSHSRANASSPGLESPTVVHMPDSHRPDAAEANAQRDDLQAAQRADEAGNDENAKNSFDNAMGPPELPRLQMPSSPYSMVEEVGVNTTIADDTAVNTGPRTPVIQPVPSASLPLPSPFPSDLRIHSLSPLLQSAPVSSVAGSAEEQKDAGASTGAAGMETHALDTSSPRASLTNHGAHDDSSQAAATYRHDTIIPNEDSPSQQSNAAPEEQQSRATQGIQIPLSSPDLASLLSNAGSVFRLPEGGNEERGTPRSVSFGNEDAFPVGDGSDDNDTDDEEVYHPYGIDEPDEENYMSAHGDEDRRVLLDDDDQSSEVLEMENRSDDDEGSEYRYDNQNNAEIVESESSSYQSVSEDEDEDLRLMREDPEIPSVFRELEQEFRQASRQDLSNDVVGDDALSDECEDEDQQYAANQASQTTVQRHRYTSSPDDEDQSVGDTSYSIHAPGSVHEIQDTFDGSPVAYSFGLDGAASSRVEPTFTRSAGVPSSLPMQDEAHPVPFQSMDREYTKGTLHTQEQEGSSHAIQDEVFEWPEPNDVPSHTQLHSSPLPPMSPEVINLASSSDAGEDEQVADIDLMKRDDGPLPASESADQLMESAIQQEPDQMVEHAVYTERTRNSSSPAPVIGEAEAMSPWVEVQDDLRANGSLGELLRSRGSTPDTVFHAEVTVEQSSGNTGSRPASPRSVVDAEFADLEMLRATSPSQRQTDRIEDAAQIRVAESSLFRGDLVMSGNAEYEGTRTSEQDISIDPQLLASSGPATPKAGESFADVPGYVHAVPEHSVAVESQVSEYLQLSPPQIHTMHISELSPTEASASPEMLHEDPASDTNEGMDTHEPAPYHQGLGSAAVTPQADDSMVADARTTATSVVDVVSSSFYRLSPTPNPTPTTSRPTAPIEEIDLSQVEPDGSFFRRRAVVPLAQRAVIADSVDSPDTILVLESSRPSSLDRMDSSAPRSEPNTYNIPAQKPWMPSQELGSFLSQRIGTARDDLPTIMDLLGDGYNMAGQTATAEAERLDDDLLAEFAEQGQTSGDEVETVSDDGVVRCTCKRHDYPGSGPGGFFIQCDSCSVWQHGGCVGIVDESSAPDTYFCEICTSAAEQECVTGSPESHTRPPKKMSGLHTELPFSPEPSQPKLQEARQVQSVTAQLDREFLLTPQPTRQPFVNTMVHSRTELPTSSNQKSLVSRISEVPDVISAWFTPRNSSGTVKSEPKVWSPRESNRHRSETVDTRMSLSQEAEAEAEYGFGGTGKKVFKPEARAQQEPQQQSEKLRRIFHRASSPTTGSQGLSTALAYFYPLLSLPTQLNQSSTVDVIAVATSTSSDPVRAKAGPRDYYTIFHIADPSVHHSESQSGSDQAEVLHKDTMVEIFRPWKASLPYCRPGDVVLLRGFTVRSRKHRPYLLSCDASAWCVWRPDGKEEVKGPPVEIGEEERQEVKRLETWWGDMVASEQRGVDVE
ncbi:Histone deacetylase complex subunit [Elasticomyces elasticus]|nr:Histone deacetylase complex subunit [Elasticomyces elasticus]